MLLSNFVIIKCQWFSGKIQRCHRWAPGSIPGWRSSDTVAEWLRRLTRNQLGLSRAGSSPVSVVFFTNIFLHKKELHTKLKLHLLFFSPSLELVLFLCWRSVTTLTHPLVPKGLLPSSVTMHFSQNSYSCYCSLSLPCNVTHHIICHVLLRCIRVHLYFFAQLPSTSINCQWCFWSYDNVNVLSVFNWPSISAISISIMLQIVINYPNVF